MAAIQDLLKQVADTTLRARLEEEIGRLAKHKKFGLVFKENLSTARNGFVVDILESHGPQFADNLSKAKALAEYAETEDRIGRVQMIRKISCAGGASRFVRLDLGKGAVRTKVRAVTTDAELNALFV